MLQIHSLEELYSYLTRHKYRAYKSYYSIDKLAKDICKQADNILELIKEYGIDEYRHTNELLDYSESEALKLAIKENPKGWFNTRTMELHDKYIDIMFTMIQQILNKESYRFITVTVKLLENLLINNKSYISCEIPFKNAFIPLPINNQLGVRWINIKIYDSSDDNFLNETLGGWIEVYYDAKHALGMPYGDEKNSIFNYGNYDRTAPESVKRERWRNEDNLTKERAFIFLWWCCDTNGHFLSDWTCLDKLRNDNVEEYRQRIASRHQNYKDSNIDWNKLDEINNFVINFIGYLTEPSQIVYAPQPETIEPTRKMKASEKLNLKSYTFLDVKPEVIIKKEPVGTHKSPEPHLRRGHYRRQRYGKGLEQEKLIFIPELKVNEPK